MKKIIECLFLFLQIYFEGICGIGYRSDVVIDDIIVSEGECGMSSGIFIYVFGWLLILIIIVLNLFL